MDDTEDDEETDLEEDEDIDPLADESDPFNEDSLLDVDIFSVDHNEVEDVNDLFDDTEE